MAHPQGTPRGYFAKKRIDVGSSQITYNSTGLVLSAALYLSGATGSKMTGNSTGVIAVGSVTVSNQAVFGKVSANSTALVLPNSVRVGAKTTYLSSNSTGVKLGSLYISCNSTGNTTT